ncbi:MAG: cytochrome c-type biogenesis protein [bacterium]|nr:cytochrome c-type biogenesis protein [bacterium]
MRTLIFILTLMLLTPAVYSANYTDEALEQRVREISHKLRCPTCQAMSVKESEAGLSNNMKAMIRAQLQEGKSEEEILKFFVARYGEWILRNPTKSGFNLLLWFGPGVLMVLIGIWVVWRAKRRELHLDPYSPELSQSESAEVEADLKKLSQED